MSPTVYDPPVETYIALAEIELASSTSEVVLTGFSQSYSDLILVFEGKGTANSYLFAYPNGDTGNVTQVLMQGDGTSGTGSSFSGLSWGTINTSTRTTAILQFMDFSATNKFKTILIRDNESDTNTIARAANWASLEPITSIVIDANAGDIGAGSTIKLFGIEV